VVALRHQIPQRVGSSKCSHCVLLKLAVLGPSFERDQHLDRTIFWYAALILLEAGQRARRGL
jgi:hypothetical protein